MTRLGLASSPLLLAWPSQGGANDLSLQGRVEPPVPRPPASVIGGEWSPWLLMAIAVILVLVLAGAWLLLYRKRSDNHLPLPTATPREAALRELDRIRSMSWHENGRMKDFYTASTGVLRTFGRDVEPEWNEALTSHELLTRFEERWGSDSIESLTPVVAVAEEVKFGRHRPDPEAAVEDWMTIRRWIQEAPGDS